MRQTGVAWSHVSRGLFVFLAVVAARASTITIATGTDTSLATAQAVSLTPDLVVKQAPPNYTLPTAQSVSPQYMAEDVLGSITNGHNQEFFSMPAKAGDLIHIFVSAGIPANQFPELLLYDQNQNLVAIAAGNAADGSSSVIDFTVPGGGSGNWIAEVTGSPNAPDPNNNFFNYDLRVGSPIKYQTDVLGALTDPNKPGFYAISTNAGDPLHLFVSAGTPATQFPELLLYDQNQNLVAIAAGNTADSSSSIIDFTVPGGGSGNWFAEVAGSPNGPDPNNNLFNYDLQINGATGGGRVDPLASIVPEPSSLNLTLMAGSLIGLGLIRRRSASRTIS